MRFLVFQHLAVEDPGLFLGFWREAGVEWDVVELDDGAAIPDWDGYDLLVVMGGPMDVWQEDAHPWLVPEKAAIRRWVEELRRPFLGVCLGHQLLATALGGRVGLMPASEVGIAPVALTPAGQADPIFAGLPPSLEALHWHGAAIVAPLPGAEVLAHSARCAIQAIRVGRHAYGLQFHVEAGPTTVADWREIPAYRDSLEAALGPDGAASLEADMAARRATFTSQARRLNDNLMRIIAS